jgi:hypothetical protein
MWEAWITLLSCLLWNISQEGRNRLGRSKKLSYKHWDFRHRHTRDSLGWQHCVVIPLAKHLAGTTGKVAKEKNVLSVDREGKKDGQRLDRFYVIICIIAMQWQMQCISRFLLVSSGFHFHEHAFRSLLRVFMHYPTCTLRPWRHTSMRRITDITQ